MWGWWFGPLTDPVDAARLAEDDPAEREVLDRPHSHPDLSDVCVRDDEEVEDPNDEGPGGFQFPPECA